MSYVLNSKRKKFVAHSKRTFQSTRTPNVPRTTASAGGQIQIRRQAPTRVTPGQKAQVDMNTVVGMDMAKVLEDLKILKQQQEDSVAQLEQARQKKKRYQEEQHRLESHFDKIKYENGQRRAEISRMHGKLSQTQPKVSASKLIIEKAGGDLGACHRKLTMALAVKDSLPKFQDKLDRTFEQAQAQLVQLEKALNGMKEKCAEACAKHNSVKSADAKDRADLQGLGVKQKSLSTEFDELRSKTVASEEQQLASVEKGVSSLMDREESLDKEESDARSRHETVMGEFEAKLQEHQRLLDDMDSKIESLKPSVSQAKQATHSAWEEVVALQKEEKHSTSPPPSESTEIPCLDLNRIRSSLKAEEDATTEEAKESDKLRTELQDLESQKATLQSEFDACSSKVKEVCGHIESKKTTVDENKVATDKLVEQIKSIERQMESKKAELEDVSESRLKAEKRRDSKIETLGDNCEQAEADLRKKRHDIEQLTATIQTAKAKRAFEKKERREIVDKLKKRVAYANSSASRIVRNMSRMEEYEKEISAILKKYPKLAKIEIEYRPDLDVKDHATLSLKSIIDECKKRRKASRERKANSNKKPVSIGGGDAMKEASVLKPRALADVFLIHKDDEASNSDDQQRSVKSVSWRDGAKHRRQKKSVASSSSKKLSPKSDHGSRKFKGSVSMSVGSGDQKRRSSSTDLTKKRASSSNSNPDKLRTPASSSNKKQSTKSGNSGDQKRRSSNSVPVAKKTQKIHRSSSSNPTTKIRSSNAPQKQRSTSTGNAGKKSSASSLGSRKKRSTTGSVASRSTKKTGNKFSSTSSLGSRKRKTTTKSSLQGKKRRMNSPSLEVVFN